MKDRERHTPPRDFDALKAILVARQPNLPKRLAQTAAFVVHHPEETALGTAASLAEKAGVQPSTLVRLAQTLGFSGFSDLQAVFRENLLGTGRHAARLKALEERRAASPGVVEILDELIVSAAGSLDRLRETADPQVIEQAVGLMAGADTIYLIGQRRAFPLTAYLAYSLAQLRMKSVLVDNLATLAPEEAAFATPADVALAFSFTPYTPVTIQVAASLSQREVPVVAITDSPFSPLVANARCWIEVVEADFAGFRTLSASLCLAMTLAIAAAERRAGEQGTNNDRSVPN